MVINEIKYQAINLKEQVGNLKNKLIQLPKEPITGLQLPIPPAPHQMQEIHAILQGTQCFLLDVENNLKNICDTSWSNFNTKVISLREQICALQNDLPRLPKEPLTDLQPFLPPLPYQVEEINDVFQAIEALCDDFEKNRFFSQFGVPHIR